jgi:hypothetical protein
MRRFLWFVAGVAIAAPATNAFAEYPVLAPRAVAPPPRVVVSGYVDVYAALNLNAPYDGASFVPGVGTTAKRADAFSLNVASLSIDVAPRPVGGHLTIIEGNGAEVVHAGEPVAPGTGPGIFRNVLTASVDYLAPIGKGLLVEAGIYPSHIGYEVFPSKDNWTYTRAWMGELSPYYQTGVKLHYGFTSSWSAELHVLNGWQLIGDNNDAKAIGTQIAYSSSKVQLTFNTFAGPELAHDNRDWRLFGDLVAVVNATSRLAFAVTADAGLQQRPAASDAKWEAIGANVRFAGTSRVAIVGRGEVFHDPDNAVSGAGQTLVEGTITLAVRPAAHLLAKLEARYDQSTASVFEGHTLDATSTPVTRTSQALIVLGVVVDF